MAKAYNKTIIIGRLGNDPELSKDGKKASFTLCNSTVRDGVEDVQWHQIYAVGKQIPLVMDYLHKGDLVCIEGSLTQRKVQKDGETFYKTAIVSEHITFLTSRKREQVA